MAESQQLWTWLNEASLVVMAGGFLYMVKVVVNDNKHDIAAIRELLTEIKALLEREGRGR